MGKQAAIDRLLFGAVRRVVRDAYLQPKPIGQVLQRLLEQMAILSVGAVTIAQQQLAPGTGE
jgi:hypothetical protein